MASYNLTGKYETLLSVLSNDFSVELGKRISKREVLELILDIVIEEKRLFAMENEQPVSFFRRTIFKNPSTNPFKEEDNDLESIITRIKGLDN